MVVKKKSSRNKVAVPRKSVKKIKKNKEHVN